MNNDLPTVLPPSELNPRGVVKL